MKNLIIGLLLTLLNFGQSNAQVGINTITPNSSSMLEINATNKGILIPRVELQSTTDRTTVANPANSLLVFNKTAINDLVIGFYYWSAPRSKWIQVLDEASRPGMFFATFNNSTNSVFTNAFPGPKSFNFPNVKFNSIEGASINLGQLSLPPGNYMVESSVYINRDNIDYILRVNGVQTGLRGTIATVKTQSEIVPQNQMAIFTLTETSNIDFIPLSNNGGATLPVTPELSYLKITKF